MIGPMSAEHGSPGSQPFERSDVEVLTSSELRELASSPAHPMAGIAADELELRSRTRLPTLEAEMRGAAIFDGAQSANASSVAAFEAAGERISELSTEAQGGPVVLEIARIRKSVANAEMLAGMLEERVVSVSRPLGVPVALDAADVGYGVPVADELAALAAWLENVLARIDHAIDRIAI